MYQVDEKFPAEYAIFNISNIITQFIKLAEETDVVILVKNTQLINFIEYFFQTIYLKDSKNLLIDILVNLSHHTSNVVLNMIQGRDNFVKTIKNNLNDNDFNIKFKFVEIVYSMLSLLSLDINIILYKNEIIEHLIKVNLPFEEEKTCLKYVLSSILYFINSIKPLIDKYKIEIINELIKIGILNGLENMTTRFDEEHLFIINEINSEMKKIIGNENNTTPSENEIKSNEIKNDNQNNNINTNPFLLTKNI
jgi:hypothetical protein